jgi:hypothetical protein
MKIHLAYVEPEQSVAAMWKKEYFVQYANRRAILKQIGRDIAQSGVMQKPIDQKKVVMYVTGRFKRGENTTSPWGYSLIRMLGSLLGPVWMDATIRDWNKFNAYTATWEQVAWVDESWWQHSPYLHLHSLHQSVENPANVAYAENLQKLKAERYTSTKAGRYLTRFFGGGNGEPAVLTEAQIKMWAEKQAARACPAELKYVEHDDKAGWVKVYKDGPDSCMSGENCVSVYAHKKSVLRLAYLVQGDEIMGRCIVREDEKEYIRCYPNTNGAENQKWHTAMRNAVEGAGYTLGNLNGVLLDKVSTGSRYKERYVMPYLDMGRGGDSYVLDMGDCFRVGCDGVEAQNTGGYIDYNPMRCDECGDSMAEDNSCYVDTEDIYVCECCYNNNFVSALGYRGNEVQAREDDCVEVSGTYYLTEYLSDNNIYRCEDSDNYYHIDDLASTSRGLINTDLAISLDEEDSGGNTMAHPDDTVTTHDGRTIHEDTAVQREVNGEEVTFHVNDDIDAYIEEHSEEEETA